LGSRTESVYELFERRDYLPWKAVCSSAFHIANMRAELLELGVKNTQIAH
jgi:hypothetical protein